MDRIYNVSDDAEELDLIADDFYCVYLQNIQSWDSNHMKRLFQAHQRTQDDDHDDGSSSHAHGETEMPMDASEEPEPEPYSMNHSNGNDTMDQDDAETTTEEASIEQQQQPDIHADDSLEIVLQKYEAAGTWHRRIDTFHLHADARMHHCQTNASYELRDFVEKIVIPNHPHWKVPPQDTTLEDDLNLPDDHDEEEEEASGEEQDEDSMANEETMSSQDNTDDHDAEEEDDDRSFPKPPTKRSRATPKRTSRPAKKRKSAKKKTTTTTTKTTKATAVSKSLLQSLTEIGVEFHPDNTTCYFAKEPTQVFQSVHGILQFIVMHGCPAPTKKPSPKHLAPLNQYVQSQFPVLSKAIRNRPLLPYERIRTILTGSQTHPRFEVCDGKIYDPKRTRRSAAVCKTDVDRFDETDFLRIANCILRQRICTEKDVWRWCANYAGVQFWKSDRERPSDWTYYQSMMEAPLLPAEEHSTTTTTKVARTRKPKSTRYWQTEDLPSNHDVTRLLRDLGVEASNGSVRLFGRVFSMLAARKIFCRFGLPKLPAEPSEILRRWVAFANIGIASHGSSRALRSVRSLEGDRLKIELIDLGFYFEAGVKIFVPEYKSLKGGPNMYGTKYQHGLHYFKDDELLTEVRSYVRCRPDIMEDASIEVRLWACVSSLATLAQMQDGIETTAEFRRFLDQVELEVNHDEDTSWDGSASIVSSPGAARTPSEIDVSSAADDTRSISSPSSCDSSDSGFEWYRKTGSIPRFNDVYPYLEQIGFSWSGVFYLKTTDSRITFDSHLAIAKFLMTNGMPNVEALSHEERKKISRWATFAFVPVPLSESGKILRRVVPPSTKKSTETLLTKFGFAVQDQGILPPGASDTGEIMSLEQVRVFIRSREEQDFNVLPVELRPRSSRHKMSVSDDDRLALRLWAATAPDPLPEYTSNSSSNEMPHNGSNAKDVNAKAADGDDSSVGRNDDDDGGAVDMMMVEQHEPALSANCMERTSFDHPAYLTQDQPECHEGDIAYPRIGTGATATKNSTEANIDECLNDKTPFSGAPVRNENPESVHDENIYMDYLTQDHGAKHDTAAIGLHDDDMEVVPDFGCEDIGLGAMNGLLTQDVSDWDHALTYP